MRGVTWGGVGLGGVRTVWWSMVGWWDGVGVMGGVGVKWGG